MYLTIFDFCILDPTNYLDETSGCRCADNIGRRTKNLVVASPDESEKHVWTVWNLAIPHSTTLTVWIFSILHSITLSFSSQEISPPLLTEKHTR